MNKPTATNTKIWNSIADTFSLESGYGRDGAVKLADEVLDALNQRDMYTRQNDYDLELRRRHRKQALFAFVVFLVVFGVLGWGIHRIISVHADDYAGMDSHKVRGGAYDVIHNWYGDNDMPKNLVMLTQSKSQVNGRSAWLTRWRAGNGKPVCAFIWQGDSNYEGKVAPCPQ